MNEDLISRQDAIDVLESITWYHIGKSGELVKGANSRYDEPLYKAEDVYKALEKLSSAEPEIIRCGQCKYAEVADPEDSQDGYTCQFHRGSIWFSGSFCSWAERRTDG